MARDTAFKRLLRKVKGPAKKRKPALKVSAVTAKKAPKRRTGAKVVAGAKRPQARAQRVITPRKEALQLQKTRRLDPLKPKVIKKITGGSIGRFISIVPPTKGKTREQQLRRSLSRSATQITKPQIFRLKSTQKKGRELALGERTKTAVKRKTRARKIREILKRERMR